MQKLFTKYAFHVLSCVMGMKETNMCQTIRELTQWLQILKLMAIGIFPKQNMKNSHKT